MGFGAGAGRAPAPRARAEILGTPVPARRGGGVARGRPFQNLGRSCPLRYGTYHGPKLNQNFPAPGARPPAGKFWKPPPRVAGRRLRAAPGEPQNFPGRAAYSRRPRPELNPRGKPFS